jgi:hypothetical protein
VIQRQHENARIGDRERSFHQIDILTRARQFRHIDRKVRIRHHPGERVHYQVGIAASCEIEREMVSWVVEWTKKRNALDMIQMEMTEENMGADGLVSKLLLKLLA